MFDHVTIGTGDRDASERFHRTVLTALGYGEPSGGESFIESNDFSIARATATRPVTTGLHIAFVAPSREAMEAFWRAVVDAGYRDDGAPGPRPRYGPDYEGAFLLDPDGNSAEATFHGDRRSRRRIDHLWIRVADHAASRRFYTTVGEAVGFGEAEQLADRARCARSRRRHVLDRRRSGDGPVPPRLRSGGSFDGRGLPPCRDTRRLHRQRRSGGAARVSPGLLREPSCSIPDGHNVEAVDHGR